MAQRQRDMHEQLRAEALANHRRIADLTRPLDPERLVRRPTPPGWSVGEVLEHLCVADELYARPLAMLVHTARPDAGAPAREWRPSLLGGLITTSLEKPRPIKAPKVMRPGPTPRNGVVEDFLTRDSRLTRTMDDAASLDWHALRLRMPALPWLPLKLNLGDVFRMHVVHVRRHLAQMARVVAQQ